MTSRTALFELATDGAAGGYVPTYDPAVDAYVPAAPASGTGGGGGGGGGVALRDTLASDFTTTTVGSWVPVTGLTLNYTPTVDGLLVLHSRIRLMGSSVPVHVRARITGTVTSGSPEVSTTNIDATAAKMRTSPLLGSWGLTAGVAYSVVVEVYQDGGSGTATVYALDDYTELAATFIGALSGTGGGGATTLDGLTDVATTGATDGQALVYDASTTTWGPGTITGGSGGIDDGRLIFTDPSVGGVGDGTTDNTAAFNAALATLAASGGGQLYFPPGIYNMNGTTDPVPGGVWLVGSGYDYHTPSSSSDRPSKMSVIRAGASMTRLIQLGSDATISTSGATGASIRHLVIDAAGLAQIAVKTAARRNTIVECEVGYATSKGVDMAGQNGRISFCVIDQANVGDCVHVRAYNDNKVQFNQIRQPGTTGAGVRVDTVSMTDILGNHIWAGQNGSALAAEGLVVVQGSCKGVLIQNNTIEGINGPEILLNVPTTTDTIRSLLVSNNRFYMVANTPDNTYSVVKVTGQGIVSSSHIIGNVVEGAGTLLRYKALLEIAATVTYTVRVLLTGNVGTYVAALVSGTAPQPLTMSGNTILTSDSGGTKHSNNQGRTAFNGNGSTTGFTIAHGLAAAPTSVRVTPGSAGAAGNRYATADATNITVTYTTAPASGSGNVVLNWEASL